MLSLECEANVLISSLALLSGKDYALDAYKAATVELLWHQQILPEEVCGLEQIIPALVKYNHATPLVKQQLLRMCGHAVIKDGEIGNHEAVLLRAIADFIGCSIPPFIKID
ncbi:MAG TPA: hypothetical protein DHW77_08185 [Verrucomicrobiales bacterium]|nr:hypothetical protein [Verrucomicrobiales bacterium]